MEFYISPDSTVKNFTFTDADGKCVQMGDITVADYEDIMAKDMDRRLAKARAEGEAKGISEWHEYEPMGLIPPGQAIFEGFANKHFLSQIERVQEFPGPDFQLSVKARVKRPCAAAEKLPYDAKCPTCRGCCLGDALHEVFKLDNAPRVDEGRRAGPSLMARHRYHHSLSMGDLVRTSTGRVFKIRCFGFSELMGPGAPPQ